MGGGRTNELSQTNGNATLTITTIFRKEANQAKRLPAHGPMSTMLQKPKEEEQKKQRGGVILQGKIKEALIRG